MTHCYSVPWHGLHSASTFMVIAAIFSDLWLVCPPSSLSSFPFSSPTTPRLPPPCFPPPPLPPPAYLLLCRPQAGDDLRLLEDGLAGELLQHCHDHQAGGSGQGMFLLFPFSPRDLSEPPAKMDGGNMFPRIPFIIRYVSEEMPCPLLWGRKWLPLPDLE